MNGERNIRDALIEAQALPASRRKATTGPVDTAETFAARLAKLMREADQRPDDNRLQARYDDAYSAFVRQIKRLAPAERKRLTAIASGKPPGWVTADTKVVCPGCGRLVEAAFCDVDHVRPPSDGGGDDVGNRILLCGPCNRRKSNRLTLSGLRHENQVKSWMEDRKAADASLRRVKRLWGRLNR